jgi:fructose-bisphosphate aldolase class II
MHGSSSVPQELLAVIREFGGEMPETWGVPVEQIQEGIRHGVRKVNIDTDIRLAMTGAMRRAMTQKRGEIDPRKLLKEAQIAAKALCKERYEAFARRDGAAHRAVPLRTWLPATPSAPLALVIRCRRRACPARPGVPLHYASKSV